MGSLFKTSAKAVADPGATAAFNMAKPFQQQALSGMSGIAGQDLSYNGQRVAGLNPFQTGSADYLGNFASSTGGYANDLMNTGAGNLGQSGNVGSNYADIYGRASMDPTQMIMNQAGMYANNPYVDGMIDSAGRDVTRQLTEQSLPSLARSATGSGNTNSSRAGVESAIMQRGAADRLADISSGIRGQFFGKGLDMAQGQYNQNLSNMMNANSGLMNAGQFGAGLIGAGQGFAGNNFGLGQAAGGVYQGQNQNEINADMANFNESWQNPLSVFDALSKNAANSTQVKTSAGTVESPSVFSQIGSFVGGMTKR